MDLCAKHAAHVQGDAVRNAHEGQVTTGTHAAESLIEGCLIADRLNDAVGAQAVGQFLDAGDALLAALFDDVGRTELAGQCPVS